jgi:purine-binding chemotaxis protein CheW
MTSGQGAVTPTLADAVSRLDARVLAGAARPIEAPAAERRPGTRFIRFTVGATSYAVRGVVVTELDRVPRVTLVPQAPAWLRGVTNLRGEILSVVDLRVFLGLDPTPSAVGRMLVLRLPGEDFSLGLLVDAVDGILMLEDHAIQPPASALEGPLAPFLTGMSVIGDELVAVLDLEGLLRSSDIRQFDEFQEDSRCEAI